MARPLHSLRKALVLSGFLSLSTSALFAAGISATATLTDTQTSSGAYNYTLNLTNTGTTTIGTFWFAWVPGAGFMTTTPSSISSPAGWSEINTNAGDAIQWTTTSSLLAAGQSLSGFNFTSTETPTQLLGTFAGSPTGAGAGDPDLTSFVYIGAPLADPGSQFVVSEAAPTVTPEPDSLVLTLTGFGLAGFATLRRRLRRTA